MDNVRLCAGGAIVKDGKILLLKRAPIKKVFPEYWCFPSGKWEEGDEDLRATAIREVKEESGLDFVPGVPLTFFEHHFDGDKATLGHIYLGSFEGDIVLNEESTEFQWFTYEEAIVLPLAFKYREVIERMRELNIL